MCEQAGEDGLGALSPGVADPSYAYSPARRRCITPVNETTPTATDFSPSRPFTPVYHHPSRRPDTVEPPSSYYSSSCGRRSLPRLGRVLPPVHPAAFYHHAVHGGSSASLSVPAHHPSSQSVTSDTHWTPACGVGSRPASSATSTASADNIRKTSHTSGAREPRRQGGQVTPGNLSEGSNMVFDPPDFFGKKYFLVHSHTESTS